MKLYGRCALLVLGLMVYGIYWEGRYLIKTRPDGLLPDGSVLECFPSEGEPFELTSKDGRFDLDWQLFGRPDFITYRLMINGDRHQSGHFGVATIGPTRLELTTPLPYSSSD